MSFSPESLDAAEALRADEARSNEEVAPRGSESEDDSPVGVGATAESEENESADASEAGDSENTAAPRGADGEPLSDAEVEQVRELAARDLEVRQHEQAHVAAGGPYVTSGPTYQYQRGPDGKRYAVGGSVGIDVSPEDTPEKTIAKAQVVRQAALAPAQPSSQDLRVASQASQLEQQARAELNEQRREEGQSRAEPNETREAASLADSSEGAAESGASASDAPDAQAASSSQSPSTATSASVAAQLLRHAYSPRDFSPTFQAFA